MRSTPLQFVQAIHQLEIASRSVAVAVSHTCVCCKQQDINEVTAGLDDNIVHSQLHMQARTISLLEVCRSYAQSAAEGALPVCISARIDMA